MQKIEFKKLQQATELSDGRIIIYYWDHKAGNWMMAEIVYAHPDGKVMIRGLEGKMAGIEWVEHKDNIEDPDYYKINDYDSAD